ncbi:hypothetical protein NN561_008722 [Cricetulus griseus]
MRSILPALDSAGWCPARSRVEESKQGPGNDSDWLSQYHGPFKTLGEWVGRWASPGALSVGISGARLQDAAAFLTMAARLRFRDKSHTSERRPASPHSPPFRPPAPALIL